MKARKGVLGIVVCLAVVVLLLGAAGPAVAQRGKVETTFATVKITQRYVSASHLLQFLGRESFKIKVRQLAEAAIYRGLMTGKIDLGSVLALPVDVGVKEFTKSFKQPPKVMTLGHLAVSVIAPKKTGIRWLSVKQLGEVISGKITTWEQLGGSGGKIKVLADGNAVYLICALTGAKPAADLRLFSHPTGKIAALVTQEALTKGGSLCLGLSSSNRARRRTEAVAAVPVTSGAGIKAVAPTLATVRDGSYPLARPWRLILRAGAPALAERCMKLLAKHGERIDPLMCLWLIAPAVSPVPDHVRIGIKGWYYELKAAAKVYEQNNPQVTFTFLTRDLGIIPKFVNAQVDLLAHTGQFDDHLGGPNGDLWRKAYPKLPPERTVAYWPFAVVVHPKNPIESMTMEQLRALVTSRKARWPDLGRDQDGRIRLYAYYTYLIAEAMFGYDFATGRNKGPRAVSQKEQRQVSGACRKHRGGFRKNLGGYMRREDRVLKTMADEVDGIALMHHNRKLAASGLKVLPIVSGKGRRRVKPTDLPAVASGRYVLRTPLKVMVHPKAGKATKDFVAWLSSPQAGKVIRADKVRELTTYSGVLTVAHASLAARDIVIDKATPGKPTVTDTKFNQRVGGAVAVLPTEPLSMYFLMADRSHHAAYERAITEALETDGRLKLVDRTQLARVLAERKLELLGIQSSRPKPIVSADIFVLSHVVTEGTRTYLRIQAVHGPTAGLLGELKLPIDPAAPARFALPLAKTVAEWWPGVLKRLVRARTRPVWALLAVYAETRELGDLADKSRQLLQKALATDERIFLAGGAPLGQTQQEVLMRLLGLSRPRGGRFTPAADYVLDARIPSAGQIELRIRRGDLAVVEQATLTGTDDKKLLAAAGDWLVRQVAKHAAKPKPLRPSADVEDKWAAKQARLEYKLAKKLRRQYVKLQGEAESRKLDKSQSGLPPEDEAELRRLGRNYWQHVRRAAQLDPAWEEASYAAAKVRMNLVPRVRDDSPNRFTLHFYKDRTAAAQRFLDVFPYSRHHEEVLYWYILDCMQAGKTVCRGALPKGLDAKRIGIAYLRKGLEGYARYMEQYRLTGKGDSHYQAYMCFRHYMYWLRKYIALAAPSEKELQAIVDNWSQRYDRHLDKAPHSDFVRLMILRYKADKPGYLVLLRKLQKRWPDPKHPQWKETSERICEATYRMFSCRSSNNSFLLWLRGKRGIGDLPYVGYDAAKVALKEEELRGMLMIYCQGWKKALRAAGGEFKKLHPKTRVMFLQLRGDDKLTRAAEGPVRIIAYVGPLTDDQRKRLEEVYRRRLSEQLIGYIIKPDQPDSSKREPVMLLLGPRSEQHRIANAFVKFIATPAARAAMAKHNVHNKIARPKTATAPAGRDAASKEN